MAAPITRKLARKQEHQIYSDNEVLRRYRLNNDAIDIVVGILGIIWSHPPHNLIL